MPQYFRFRIGHRLVFQGELLSARCQAHTRAGRQCGRQTVIGLGLCWTHLMSVRHLKIQTSTIPGAGKGLFALDRARPHRQVLFHTDAIICEYGGEILDEDEKDERYEDKTAPYAVKINRNRYEDGATERGVGSLCKCATSRNKRQCKARFV
jgi:hypothetical protein